MSTTPRWIVLWTGILGFTGVGLGALGAHGSLHDLLVATGTVDHWRTAVLYQLVHAVALLALAGWSTGAKVQWIARLWTLGIVLFSGSLYGLALGGPKTLGPITPLGGLALLLGWLLVVWSSFQITPKA